SAAVLTQLTHYIDAGGGSRGARIVIDPQGKCLPQTRRGAKEEWRCRSERAEDQNHSLTIKYSKVSCINEVKSLRMQPCINGIYFEKNWPEFW
ncbi:oxidoreductase, partial [Escherichia coli]|nr:oxidoreductase [Escherichia coli]